MRCPTRFLLLLAAAALALGACGTGRYIEVRVAGPARAPMARAAQGAVEIDEDWRRASDVPHVSVFYDALAPYGTWELDRELGWIWSPSDVHYAPYARGRWVETEAGPTFLADEPFGWAVAHYGRWLWRDGARPGVGRWAWVPGTRWGPAWVAWRVSDEHVGWRALPPADWTRPLPDHAWHFVAARDFLGPSVSGRTYGLSDVPWLVASSRPHEREAEEARFVVGPEVRFSGWRAYRVPLGRLPPSQVRWVPRWERGELRPARRSIRVGPDAPERPARRAPVRP